MREMERADFQAVADAVFTCEKEIVEAGDTSSPKLLVFRLTDDHKISNLTPFSVAQFFDESMGTAGKNVLAHLLDTLTEKMPEDGILALVTEAWISHQEEGTDVSKVVPSEDPNRKEAITVMMRTRHQSIFVYYPISRNPNRLSKSEIDFTVMSSGRFSGKPPKEKMH